MLIAIIRYSLYNICKKNTSNNEMEFQREDQSHKKFSFVKDFERHLIKLFYISF